MRNFPSGFRGHGGHLLARRRGLTSAKVGATLKKESDRARRTPKAQQESYFS